MGLFGPSTIDVRVTNHTPDAQWVTVKPHSSGSKTLGSSKSYKLDTMGTDKWERVKDKKQPIIMLFQSEHG